MYYFVIVDAYSKWPEVIAMKTVTSRATVRVLSDLFTKYGFPETIVSDNGTQFVSSEFRSMCEEYGITHLRTAPYHPQSNGQAERFVDTFKRGFAKLKGEGKPTERALEVFLHTYRATPSETLNGRSPAELFLGRKLRTRLSLLHPKTGSSPDCRADLRTKMESQFNLKHGSRSRDFHVGDRVIVKVYRGNNWSWKNGTLVAKIGRVLWNVDIDGKVQKRHENQMKVISSAASAENSATNWLNVMLSTYNLKQPDVLMPAANSPDRPAVVRFEDTDEEEFATPVAVQRRSTRNRRPPRRYSPYAR